MQRKQYSAVEQTRRTLEATREQKTPDEPDVECGVHPDQITRTNKQALTTQMRVVSAYQRSMPKKVSLVRIPDARKPFDQQFITDLLTIKLPARPISLSRTDPSASTGFSEFSLPLTQFLPPQHFAASSERVAELPAKSENRISSLSQKMLAISQRTSAVTHTEESASQKMLANSQHLLALLSHQPYRVEQLKVMTAIQQVSYVFLVFGWVATNLYFWYWWFQSEHIGNPILFALISIAFFYEATVLPSFYTFYLGNMRKPGPVSVNAMDSRIVKKVAVISLTVPGSENIEIVKQQMISMAKIDYPHDSWILVDKVHSPEIQALAREMGVFYFSRHDIATWGEKKVKQWNQPVPPFKARTKAGNVNSWIDAYGSCYSHFTQLDIDHRPLPSYLHKVLGYFLDTKVKWVQAPSVYGNLEHWTARGSAEQELVLQGPLQMGFYGFSQTPFIIGSHCTYDMEAIREIGGFQPTRAEDHLDTIVLAAHGYQGVFLPDIIAVGDGPENFDTYLEQQFAWAYSMIQVLFNYTSRCIKKYTLRQSLQFLFVQTWYILWSLSMFLLFLLPNVSLFLNEPIAHVSYWDFLLHSLPLTSAALLIWAWSHSWHKPNRLRLSWRGVILYVARWPVVLSAFVQVILRVQKPYMITVKGLQHRWKQPFPLKSQYPYIGLILLSLGACWFHLLMTRQSSTQGYLLFALQGAAIILLVYITALVMDMIAIMHEGIPFFFGLLMRIKPLLLLIMLLGIYTWTACNSWAAIYTAIISQ